jgi:hypothetical protein
MGTRSLLGVIFMQGWQSLDLNSGCPAAIFPHDELQLMGHQKMNNDYNGIL